MALDIDDYQKALNEFLKGWASTECDFCKPIRTVSREAALTVFPPISAPLLINPQGCPYTHVKLGGKVYKRKYETESNCEYWKALPTYCHDCGVKFGNTHHTGCDVESCPKCGGQFLYCECRDDGEVYFMGIKDKTGKFIKYEVESLDIPNDEWLTDHLDVIKGCSEDWLKDCKDEDRSRLEKDAKMSQAILDIIKTNSGKNIVSIPEDYWDWLNLHLTMYIDFKRDHLNGADEEEREFLEHDLMMMGNCLKWMDEDRSKQYLRRAYDENREDDLRSFIERGLRDEKGRHTDDELKQMAKEFDVQKGADFEDIWNRSVSFVDRSNAALEAYNDKLHSSRNRLRPVKWSKKDKADLK